MWTLGAFFLGGGGERTQCTPRATGLKCDNSGGIEILTLFGLRAGGGGGGQKVPALTLSVSISAVYLQACFSKF